MLRMSILATILMTGLAMAEPPPPVPDGGLTHYDNKPCADPVTGLQGKCFYSHDNRNNRYMAFYTDGDLCMYIEQLIDGKYVEIWRRGADV